MKLLALAALIAAFAAPACVHGSTVEPSGLTLTFEPAAQTGTVMMSLFDSEAAYSGGAPAHRTIINVADGQRTAVFRDLPPGNYAVKAFHDVDGNGRMNTNPFGRPVEPVAFSNNAPANLGPAAWARAQFTIRGNSARTIIIR